MIPESVFKAYDIRGRTDSGELSPELFRLIGGAFVELTGPGEIAVGRDCRESSDGLFRALVEGINGAGADVVDLGEVPTDLVYFYSGRHDVPGAVITASHNPPEYNGLKLCRAGAAPVGAESGLEEIKQSVMEGRVPTAETQGTLRRVDALDEYVDHLLGIVDPTAIAALRVAVDGGNGMAGVTVEKVLSRLEATLDGQRIHKYLARANGVLNLSSAAATRNVIAVRDEQQYLLAMGASCGGPERRGHGVEHR